MRQLVHSSVNESGFKREHQKALLLSKEQERRKLAQKLDNLFELISEEEDGILRSGLAAKAKEIQIHKDQVEGSLMILKEEHARSASNVIELGSAFQILKKFRENFESADVAAQTEILRDIVKKIVVKTDKVVAEFYGSAPIFVGMSSFGGHQKLKNPAGSTRSGVRTVSKLVGMAGFEPTTCCSRSTRATRLRYTPIIFSIKT